MAESGVQRGGQVGRAEAGVQGGVGAGGGVLFEASCGAAAVWCVRPWCVRPFTTPRPPQLHLSCTPSKKYSTPPNPTPPEHPKHCAPCPASHTGTITVSCTRLHSLAATQCTRHSRGAQPSTAQNMVHSPAQPSTWTAEHSTWCKKECSRAAHILCGFRVHWVCPYVGKGAAALLVLGCWACSGG